jgi:hypothetical protein
MPTVKSAIDPVEGVDRCHRGRAIVIIEAMFIVAVLSVVTVAAILGLRLVIRRLREPRARPTVTHRMVFASVAWNGWIWFTLIPPMIGTDPTFQARAEYWSVVYSVMLLIAIPATAL